jgi:hypothetical protein
VTRVADRVPGKLAVTRISTPSSRLALRTFFTSSAPTAVEATNMQLAPVLLISWRSPPMVPSTGSPSGAAPSEEPVATNPSGR